MRAARPAQSQIGALALILVLLGGCGGAVTGQLQREGTEVTAGGDTFFVTRSGNRATARNYATGLFNQERLYRNAQEAIIAATGCELAHLQQETGVNAYHAHLACA